MIAEIFIGLGWVVGALLLIWAVDTLYGGNKSDQWEMMLVACFALGFGGVLFMVCAIHYGMIAVHHWGCSRPACWGYGTLLVLGQMAVVWPLFLAVRWMIKLLLLLLSIAWCLAAMHLYGKAAAQSGGD